MNKMQFYLQDITSKIPLLSLVVVLFFVLSMENKMHWLLLVPLVICLGGIYIAQRPLQSYRNMILSMILFLCIMILGLALFLDPQVEKTDQIVLRGLSLVCMLFVSILVIVSSFHNNTIYMEMFSMMLVIIFSILFFLWVSIQNETMRTISSIVLTILYIFFLFQYMKNLSSFSSKRESPQAFMLGSHLLKQLPSSS